MGYLGSGALARLWDDFGMTFGWLLDDFEITLASLWDHDDHEINDDDEIDDDVHEIDVHENDVHEIDADDAEDDDDDDDDADHGGMGDDAVDDDADIYVTLGSLRITLVVCLPISAGFAKKTKMFKKCWL